MTLPISNIGTRQDITIRQGASFALLFTATNASDEPVDITGYEFSGSVRRKASSSDQAALFSYELLDQASPATIGQARLYLSDSDTSSMICGDSEADTLSRYHYDIDLISPGGARMPILYGVCLVKAKGDLE